MSVPLAILMSSAVRIKAMRVELKWTVLSSATGRSIRSSLCGEAIKANSEKMEEKLWWHVEPPGNKGRGAEFTEEGEREWGEVGKDWQREVGGAMHSISSFRCVS